MSVPVGLAVDAATVLVVRGLVAPDHPRVADAILYRLATVRIVLGATKVTDLRAHAVRRP